jgi:hypothetical protein
MRSRPGTVTLSQLSSSWRFCAEDTKGNEGFIVAQEISDGDCCLQPALPCRQQRCLYEEHLQLGWLLPVVRVPVPGRPPQGRRNV